MIEQELCEGPSVCHELLVVADLGDLAVLHHDDLVHVGQEADGVRHQDPGLLLQEAWQDKTETDITVFVSSYYIGTCPICYSDSAGKPKKCHCKAIVTLSDDLKYKKVLLGPKNCHCSQIVTLTNVTATNMACS